MGIIRTEQTRLLQDNGTENIEFFVYDKNGDARAPLNQSKDVLKQVPSVMQPINSNLMVEYLRPLRDAIKTTNSDDSNIINKNPNFRYSTFNWDITAAKAEVAIPSQLERTVIPISGLYCLRQPILTAAPEKTTHMVKNILLDTPVVSGRAIEISYNYHIWTLGFTAQGVYQYMSVGLDSTGNGTVNKMYNFEENKFETGTFTNDEFFRKIDITTIESWNLYRTELECNLTGSETSPYIEVKLFEVSAAGLSPVAFFDGFSISQKPDSKTRVHTKRSGGRYTTIDGQQTAVEDYVSGEYKQEDTILSNEVDSQNPNSIFGIFVRKDRPLSAFASNTLDKNVLQEIMNDFREPLKRYEGEFYKDDSDEVPLYFYHKLWINFGTTVLQEPVSCIIDRMEYDVKQNKYNIVMHMPNQDDDQLSYDLYKLKD